MGPVKQMDEGPSTRPLRPLWSDIYCDSDFILLGHRSTSLNVGMREALSLRDFGFVMFLYYWWSFKLGHFKHQGLLSMSPCYSVVTNLDYTFLKRESKRVSEREVYSPDIKNLKSPTKSQKAAQCFKTIMFKLIFRAYI